MKKAFKMSVNTGSQKTKTNTPKLPHPAEPLSLEEFIRSDRVVGNIPGALG